jgi:hypothetical protein
MAGLGRIYFLCFEKAFARITPIKIDRMVFSEEILPD